MASRRPSQSRNMVLSASFGIGCQKLIIGTQQGIRTYDLDGETIKVSASSKKRKDILAVGVYYSTSMIAYSELSTKFLTMETIVDDSEQVLPRDNPKGWKCEDDILDIQFCFTYLIVAFSAHIQITNIDFPDKHRDLIVPRGQGTIFAVSSNESSQIIAYPWPDPDEQPRGAAHSPPKTGPVATSGTIAIANLADNKPFIRFKAHSYPLSAIALNQDGSLVATASESGTIIRVFKVDSPDPVFEFRRGTDQARIYSLAFNTTSLDGIGVSARHKSPFSSSLLCVASSKQTIHIFRLSKENQKVYPASGSTSTPVVAEGSTPDSNFVRSHHRGSSMGLSRSQPAPQQKAGARAGLWSLAALAQQAVSDFMGIRRFAYITLPTQPDDGVTPQTTTKPIRRVGISSDSRFIYVFTSEGILYTYMLNLVHGGECVQQSVTPCSEPIRGHTSRRVRT